MGLPTIRDEAIAIAAAATKARLTHQAFLAHVLLAECDDREARRRIRRVNEAKFPGPNASRASTSPPSRT